MNKPIPAYLRLHVEQRPSASEAALSELEDLCARFARATGWPLRVRSQPSHSRTPVQLVMAPAQADSPPATASSAEAAQDLVDGVHRLLDRIYQLETALWQREAELAAGVPVSQRPDEPKHLAERLEAILRGACEAVGADAAALYMLDEATSVLKVRAVAGLPFDRLLAPPRPLRGAVADLEALVGHAVVLEDTSLLAHWKVPEDFPSAVCIPVSTPTTPLGTLWLFASQPRDFSAAETNILEIVAGRIATELEREMLLEEGVRARDFAKQFSAAGRRQQERLPTFAPVVDDWECSAWSASGDRVTGDFYDWGVHSDGRLYFTAGSASGTPLEASLTITTVQAALKSHMLYPHHPRQMLERINETLWTGSTGDQFASLFYALVDPESGQVEYAFAGRIHALVTSLRGTRPLSCPAAYLGVGPETPFTNQVARLQPGEAITIVSDALLRLRSCQGEMLPINALAEALRGGAQSAENMIDQARAAILSLADPQRPLDGTLLVARRMDHASSAHPGGRRPTA